MPNLFSYGTLQLPQVQMELFKRKLVGEPDVLHGYQEEELILHDPTVIGLSQTSTHVILVLSENPKDSVKGIVYEITEAQLGIADNYETKEYRREFLRLASGKKAWVYLK